MPFPEFLDLLTGWILEGKSSEDRNRIIRILNGEILTDDEGERDERLAEAYREDGENDLQIEMRKELRHARTTMEKAQIRAKYADKAATLMEQRKKAETGIGDG